MWSYHIWLSIHQSIDEHLYCFCFLALERNAAVNIHAQVFVWTCVFFSLGCIARSGALGHVVAPCLIIEDSPKWPLHLHCPLQRGRFQCVPILVSTCNVLSAGFQLSQRHEAVTHCGFDFCSLTVMLKVFSLIIGQYVWSLEECLCQSCLFKKIFFWSFYYGVVSAVYMIWQQVPDWLIFCPILWVVFSLFFSFLFF